MDVVLKTDRLVLRRLTEADAEDLLALHADPAVMRFIGSVESREQVVTSTLPHFIRYDERGYGFYAAVEQDTGAFVGWFHLRPVREGGNVEEPELGYRLHRATWGRGYATEGSKALIAHAFTGLGARRVFATTMAINAGSRRVMEKAGMRFVRAFVADWPEKIEGDEHGDVEYEITRAAWEASR